MVKHTGLLSSSSTSFLQQKLQLRAPYVVPLNILQVYCLQTLRAIEAGKSVEDCMQGCVHLIRGRPLRGASPAILGLCGIRSGVCVAALGMERQKLRGAVDFLSVCAYVRACCPSYG